MKHTKKKLREIARKLFKDIDKSAKLRSQIRNTLALSDQEIARHLGKQDPYYES